MNQKGFGVIEVLVVVIITGFLLHVQNPISSSLGVGIRPNKTIQKEYTKETVELLKDENGNIIGTKTVAKGQVSDQDLQQRVSLWEQIRALPILFLILSILGAASVPGFGFMKWIHGRIKKRLSAMTAEKESLMTDTRKMVKGLDAAFASLPESLAGLPGEIDRVMLAKKIRDDMEWELRAVYNESTKNLVRSIRDAS